MNDDVALEVNRANWDALAVIHRDTDFYDLPGFLAGKSTLLAPELELAGNTDGLELLHLQCHIGLDSLSWARCGARVTGVDFAPKAIAVAVDIASRADVNARFMVGDVMDLPSLSNFDIAVTTYGVLCWIPDLESWARSVHATLRPGGKFVIVDFHPVQEYVHPGKMTGADGYFASGPAAVITRGTYADRDADIRYTEWRWQHTVGDIVSALAHGGFVISELIEYPYCAVPLFDELIEGDDGMWHPTPTPTLPYMLGILAKRI